MHQENRGSVPGAELPMSPSLIDIRKLSFSYGEKTVLSDVSFSIANGDTWSVIGKNGTGKSTLVKCLAGLLPVPRGTVLINGEDAGQIKPRERARIISYVPQAASRGVPAYTVKEFVMLGRFPYQGFMAIPTSEDIQIVSAALDLADVQDLRDRLLTTLSGGELQRVFLAGAVAQQGRILLLDEPATFLDPQHQQLVAKSLSRIHDEHGTAVLTITHDVNAAMTGFSNVLALVEGKVFYAGPVSDFRNRCPHLLDEIFNVTFARATVENSGRSVMISSEVD